MDVPYDIDNPPADPPAGADPLLWQVASALRAEHQLGLDRWCVAGTCRQRAALWPCEQRQLADAGLLGAIRGVQPPWSNERWPAARRRATRQPGRSGG